MRTSVALLALYGSRNWCLWRVPYWLNVVFAYVRIDQAETTGCKFSCEFPFV